MSFRALEHLIYSHEYNHALIDQHFDIANLENDANCANDDRCEAITALIEGDATLTMMQWLVQYAPPEDVRQLQRYRIPNQALPEQFPPDYVIHSLNFPYVQGADFVLDLFEEGNWTRVNQAYAQLPQSTEQILHPEKYRQSEAPVPVDDMPLMVVLGEQWRMLKTNTLGEWTTFLILAYGADKFAQQPSKDAETAAAGWGGDQYQVYYNENTDRMVLAAHWVWDTEGDALEFESSMAAYLMTRFRGGEITRPLGSCWEVNLQTTCLYTQANQSLWILAPDQTTLDQVLGLYPHFTNP